MGKLFNIFVYTFLAACMLYLAITAQWWPVKILASAIVAWDIYEIIRYIKKK